MNKEQQIVEFQHDIIDNLFNGGTYKLAEALYNAGYRKTFTSDFASDTQKAYKEGYIKGIEEREAEIERLKADNEALKMWNEAYTEENEKLKAENYKLENDLVDFDEFARDISKTRIKITGEAIPTCKTLLKYIEKEKRNAVKEFAEKLQKELPCRDYTFNGNTYSMILTSSIKYVIDKLLKEYEQ